MRPADADACGVRPGRDYPLPVVDHARARTRTLMRFEALHSA
jgi:deoxyribodipyrimidine photo-lyase